MRLSSKFILVMGAALGLGACATGETPVSDNIGKQLGLNKAGDPCKVNKPGDPTYPGRLICGNGTGRVLEPGRGLFGQDQPF